ncbi:MAG: hypothetical protein AAF432_16175, partial [Planctomycetota bacterium]
MNHDTQIHRIDAIDASATAGHLAESLIPMLDAMRRDIRTASSSFGPDRVTNTDHLSTMLQRLT